MKVAYMVGLLKGGGINLANRSGEVVIQLSSSTITRKL